MRDHRPLDFVRYAPPRLAAQLAAGLGLLAVLELIGWLRS